MEPLIRLARERLRADEIVLARRLGVSVGCLRNWSRLGAPPYGKLALAALIAEIDPADYVRVPPPSSPHLPAQ
jgi:DNA-binding transcriptional regulator YiaG